MLRSHKKNILIGLLTMGAFGLVYGFLSSRPEMISDETLRVSEVPRPEFEHVLNKTSAFKPDEPVESITPIANEVASALVADSDDMGGEALVSTLGNQETQIIKSAFVEAPIATPSEDNAIESAVGDIAVFPGAGLPIEEKVAQVSNLSDPFKNPFKSGARQYVEDAVIQTPQAANDVVTEKPQRESLIKSSNSDVALISDQAGFLDLNLTNTKPIEVVLLEGDEIIIDDVNETLGKYKSSDTAEQPSTTSVDVASMDMVSPFGQADANEDQDQSSDLVVLPDSDEALMKGTDAISLEYQASYKKLKSITEKLREADKENIALKNQFSQVADDNRKLAQIIRNIDEEIKVLIVKN